jgi:peptidoglycan-associated lipoprotein
MGASAMRGASNGTMKTMFRNAASVTSVAFLALACARQAAPPAAQAVARPPPALAPPVAPANEKDPPAPETIAELVRNFQRVHFEHDSTELTPTTREALSANVELMRNLPRVVVEVEGHCDESGATDYNLSLGERRATAIRRYMEAAGVEAGRIRTVSYGEERPRTQGSGAHAWAENRRAEFRVLERDAMAVRGTVD